MALPEQKTVPRILLFGTTGQVGWELQRVLQSHGTVTALSRAEADFEQPGTLRRFFVDPPDVVINAVAYTAVDQAETDVERATTINAASVAVLADEARRCGAVLIHYSTDYVFDGTGSTPYPPSAPTNPQSQYGRTKLAGEDAIRASGCDYLIVRTSWVHASRGKNFVKTILRLAAERESLRIVGDQRGTPTSARLIADVTAQLVAQATSERRAGNFTSGTYHLTASGETSWHGFATMIVDEARAMGGPALVVKTIEAIATSDYPLPAPRPAYSRLDTTTLVERFGVVLPEWEVGVRLCLAELLQR